MVYLQYYILWIISGALAIFVIGSIISYKKEGNKNDLYSLGFSLVVAVIIISVNVLQVYPEIQVHNNYDSVGYFGELQINNDIEHASKDVSWFIIVPVPAEEGLISNIHFQESITSSQLVETDYGNGLEIRTQNDYIAFSAEYVTDSHEVKYYPEMVDSNIAFWPIFLGYDGIDNLSVDFSIFQIIHQNKDELLNLHSFGFVQNLTKGWTWVKISKYYGD